MKGCWIYSLSYNCVDMVPHFLHHHRNADRIVVYDNGSTDNTTELLSKDPKVEIRSYAHATGNTLRDDIHGHIKNNCWKEAKGKAEWVVVTDFDEFLYHPQLDAKLAQYKREGVTVPLVTAYEMVGPKFPAGPPFLTDVIKVGRRNDYYSKLVIFDPNKVEEISYAAGGHNAKPVGEIKYSGLRYGPAVAIKPYPALIMRCFLDPDNPGQLTKPTELKVLHYRFVGMDRVERMWAMYQKRMSDVNLQQRWGFHYFLPDEERTRVYNLLVEQSEQVIQE